MVEGYWINYRTGKCFEIDDHELWIRRPGNAKKLGLPASIIESFGQFAPFQDRLEFLAWLLQSAPIMRIRGHGHYITCEFHARRSRPALKALRIFGKQHLSPHSRLEIWNLAFWSRASIIFQKLNRAMRSGGRVVFRKDGDAGRA